MFTNLTHENVTSHVYRAFGAKCAKCGRSVGAGDWVRRARDRVYHLACFACDTCSRQLSTGEQFALLDARLLCKAHYLDVVEGNNTSSDGENVAYLNIFLPHLMIKISIRSINVK